MVGGGKGATLGSNMAVEKMLGYILFGIGRMDGNLKETSYSILGSRSMKTCTEEATKPQ